ncbi:MAG: PAS domain-containing protein [Gammaproteobacteria bacterium]
MTSEQRYRALMDNASCGIFINNPQGDILEINKRGEILFNCNKSQIIGKNLIEFVMPDDRPYIISQLNKLQQNKPISFGEFHLQPMNSTPKVVEFKGIKLQIAK